jgi:hypothetical protein
MILVLVEVERSLRLVTERKVKSEEIRVKRGRRK